MGYGAGWAFYDLFRMGLTYYCGYQEGKERATREIETRIMRNDMDELRAKLAELNRQNAARRNGN